jgi:hypothetical protein
MDSDDYLGLMNTDEVLQSKCHAERSEASRLEEKYSWRTSTFSRDSSLALLVQNDIDFSRSLRSGIL